MMFAIAIVCAQLFTVRDETCYYLVRSTLLSEAVNLHACTDSAFVHTYSFFSGISISHIFIKCANYKILIASSIRGAASL